MLWILYTNATFSTIPFVPNTSELHQMGWFVSAPLFFPSCQQWLSYGSTDEPSFNFICAPGMSFCHETGNLRPWCNFKIQDQWHCVTSRSMELTKLQASIHFAWFCRAMIAPGFVASKQTFPTEIQKQTKGNKGKGIPAFSFLVAKWRAAGWTHAWQMAFEKDFMNHLGCLQ